MAAHEEPAQMTTEEFDRKLEELRAMLKAEREIDQTARHTHNARLHETLIGMSEQTLVASGAVRQALQQVTEVMGELKDRMGAIEVSLVGNPQLKSTGLVDTVAALKVDLAALDRRTGLLESELVATKRAVGWVRWVLVAIGATIAWVKGTQFVGWLIQKS